MNDFFQKSIIMVLLIGLLAPSLFSVPQKAAASDLGQAAEFAGITVGSYTAARLAIYPTCLAWAQVKAEVELLMAAAKNLLKQLLKFGISTNVPVTDPATREQITVSKAQTSCEDTLKKTLNATFKKRILDVMVDQLVNWIQGNGRPQFVTDYNAFLRNAANEAVGDVVQDIGLSAICSPFKFQLQLTVANPPPFSTRAACTLDQIVGNFENFYNDFSQGGWLAYNEMLRPQNNIYGAFIMSQDESLSRQAAAVEAAAKEVETGGGYLSTKRCLYWSTIDETNGQVLTQAGSSGMNPPDNQHTWKCTQAEIITPGQTVGSAVSKAIGADFDYIVNAEDVGQYIAAISDAILNRLIGDTVSGLLGMRRPTISPTEGRASGANYYDVLQGQQEQRSREDINNLLANARALLERFTANLDELTDDTAEIITIVNGEFATCYAGLTAPQQAIFEQNRRDITAIEARAEHNNTDVTDGIPYFQAKYRRYRESVNTLTVETPLNEINAVTNDLIYLAEAISSVKNQADEDLRIVQDILRQCNEIRGGGQP